MYLRTCTALNNRTLFKKIVILVYLLDYYKKYLGENPTSPRSCLAWMKTCDYTTAANCSIYKTDRWIDAMSGSLAKWIEHTNTEKTALGNQTLTRNKEQSTFTIYPATQNAVNFVFAICIVPGADSVRLVDAVERSVPK